MKRRVQQVHHAAKGQFRGKRPRSGASFGGVQWGPEPPAMNAPIVPRPTYGKTAAQLDREIAEALSTPQSGYPTLPGIGTVVHPAASDVQYRVIEAVGPNGVRVEAVEPAKLRGSERRKLLSMSRDGVLFDDRWRAWSTRR